MENIGDEEGRGEAAQQGEHAGKINNEFRPGEEKANP